MDKNLRESGFLRLGRHLMNQLCPVLTNTRYKSRQTDIVFLFCSVLPRVVLRVIKHMHPHHIEHKRGGDADLKGLLVGEGDDKKGFETDPFSS